jgi:nucleoside-diphosphate-sugar epimerase
MENKILVTGGYGLVGSEFALGKNILNRHQNVTIYETQEVNRLM